MLRRGRRYGAAAILIRLDGDTMEQHEIALRMEGLVVFRGLLKDPVVAAFMEMLRGSDERRTERVRDRKSVV